jgi:hypothetical protein
MDGFDGILSLYIESKKKKSRKVAYKDLVDCSLFVMHAHPILSIKLFDNSLLYISSIFMVYISWTGSILSFFSIYFFGLRVIHLYLVWSSTRSGFHVTDSYKCDTLQSEMDDYQHFRRDISVFENLLLFIAKGKTMVQDSNFGRFTFQISS